MRHLTKDPRRTRKRYFRCEICGLTVPASKWGIRTKKGHIKHMYCIRCKGCTRHEQVE